MKYTFRYRDQLYAGGVAEKDAGEPFAALHNRYGYDYYSFYLLLQNCGRLKSLAVGNYRLSFGQGLVMSTDYLMGKQYMHPLSTIAALESKGILLRMNIIIFVGWQLLLL